MQVASDLQFRRSVYSHRGLAVVSWTALRPVLYVPSSSPTSEFHFFLSLLFYKKQCRLLQRKNHVAVVYPM